VGAAEGGRRDIVVTFLHRQREVAALMPGSTVGGGDQLPAFRGGETLAGPLLDSTRLDPSRRRSLESFLNSHP